MSAAQVDEPIVYDRNTDIAYDNDCHDGGDGSRRYFYHQDANYRVVALTDESAGVVERYEYTSYGEPLVLGGADDNYWGEAGHAGFVSRVGNPLMHQGLYRDSETQTYQNRFRDLNSRLGRFMQRDPLRFAPYESCALNPIAFSDPLGLDTRPMPGLPKPYEPGECFQNWQERMRRYREELKQWEAEQRGPVQIGYVPPPAPPTTQPTSQPSTAPTPAPAPLTATGIKARAQREGGISEELLEDVEKLLAACCAEKAKGKSRQTPHTISACVAEGMACANDAAEMKCLEDLMKCINAKGK